MKNPQAAVKLAEKPIETVQGWIPIPFDDSPVMAPSSSHTLQAEINFAVKGPYLFRFTNPQGVRVAAITVGNYHLEGNDQPYDAEMLIANTESKQLGDQFFPIDGPTFELGNRFKVTVMNTSGIARKIGLVVYAQRANKNA